ncbi:acyl-CoA carboxylase subunit beta [Rhodococcus opacus]|uniref:acyl-CoA carboxylase subunit beta n=1 Tax=Rhodococcus opacus TaxID=37919 RepID=UPI00130043C8|nr:carboxyl transferase domain-containing protein [Rhodococcus opacus]
MAELYDHEVAERAGSDEGRRDAIARQHSRGRRSARERIDLLVDPGTFCEIGALARPSADGRDGLPLYADAIVTGVGSVDGRPAVIISTDFTVAGGSNGELGNEKLRRSWEIAATRGIPVIMLFDGGGHRIDEGLDGRDFGGGFDFQQVLARLSGWVPLVAAILGPAYGQPALTASLCDYVVAVRGHAEVGMAPQRVVRAATGEEVQPNGTYSADAQASFGGVDLAVDDETEALLELRLYLATMPSNANASLPSESGLQPEPGAAAVLDSLVPAESRRGYDMQRVIAGIVDRDSQVEFKTAYAQNMITMLATIDGMPIGIVANQPLVRAGMLDAGAARKAARLVSLCDAFALPVLILMDLPGLSVGHEAEASGLASAAAALSLEFGAATVPTFTVLVRKGYGGGYVVQSGGRTNRPELVLAWPTAQTGVMPVESAVDLIFRREISQADDPAALRRDLVERHSANAGAIRVAEGFGVDAVIRPSETRERLRTVMCTLPRRQLMQNLTPRRHPVAPL